MKSGDKMVGTKAAAEHLDVKVGTLYNWVNQGRLKVYKVGRLNKFRMSELNEFLEKRAVDPTVR